MNTHPEMPDRPHPKPRRPQRGADHGTRRRLAIGAALIAVALGALVAVEYFRGHPSSSPSPPPPHEPSNALISPPISPPVEQGAAVSGQSPDYPSEPPPPPEVVNDDTLAASPRTPADKRRPAEPPASLPAKAGPASGKGYVVQVGVFASPANAEVLKKKLKKAGIEARTETRVQIGPFKSRQDAEKALAQARKLGVNAVLVTPR
jgi:cell division septation protein DedD